VAQYILSHHALVENQTTTKRGATREKVARGSDVIYFIYSKIKFVHFAIQDGGWLKFDHFIRKC